MLEGALSDWKSGPGGKDGLLATTGVTWCLEALADLKLKLGKVGTKLLQLACVRVCVCARALC